MDDFKKNINELFEGWNTIPNWLSFIRIAAIPAFVVLFLKEHVLIAVIVMALAALTDLFDGKIARKYNMVSNLGKLLDPIADKLSQMAIVVVLIVKFWDDSIKYLFMFFIAKELVMILGGALLISMGLRPVAAEMWGKVATNIFYIGMIIILALGENGALTPYLKGFALPAPVMWGIVILAAVSALVSLLGYAPGFIKQIKEKKNAENSK